ncbi:MAG: hypothetical protein OEW68_01410 [Gammaproteobacteria bacterium]|nr:hypothetical protein [Gammaproteobacteria bacterium]MDH4313482.1 hypothetical protein [Gammaproteobacteria bacterium]MDH5213058.1 hypothetical protein [Gammaproteobacteria bacterium]
MEFTGPEAADFANVRALNIAFLQLARNGKLPRTCLQGLDSRLAKRLLELTERQAERLAGTPFLLFSFRERDARYWDQLFAEPRSRDLFAVPPPSGDEFATLVAAGLGFSWQLAQRNPFAARILAGASLHWCERISERTFFRLLAIAGTRHDLLQLRFPADTDLWAKLLDGGVMRRESIRHSAHLSALQTVLTSDRFDQRPSWPVAARKVAPPGLRIAEESGDH